MATSSGAWAQTAPPPTVSAAVYAHAETFLRGRTAPLVDDLVRRVKWLDATHFWYVDHDADGDRYEVMDAATGQVASAFNQRALASALAGMSGERVDPMHLGVADFRYSAGGKLAVVWHGKRYVCTLHAAQPAAPASSSAAQPGGQCVSWISTLAHQPGSERGPVSPNGKYMVFVRDWNLWLRNLQTGAERALTTDGVKNDGYATQNAGWLHSASGAIVRWSPDSTKLATYRQDQRQVGNMYTLQTRIGHPLLHTWKYALPGDKHVFKIAPVIINIKTGKMVKLKMQPRQRLSTLCDALACDPGRPFQWSDVKWAPDGNTLAFVTTSRNRQHERFRIANVRTGDVHTAFQFTAKDYYESGHGAVNWQYLPVTDEAIWPSERNNWLNLYLYKLTTGKLEHAITAGKGNVDQVLYLNRAQRRLWFVGNARTPGVNPYYKQLFKADIDSGKTTLLTPEDADHIITMSPGGQYFVDSYSTPTQPPVTVLRSARDGHIIAQVARANVSRLLAKGWKPPQLITVKARDGKTTLYGLMFKPTDFDPHQRYPIIDYVYPGPQTGSVFSFGWQSARLDHQAMAELGFIVVAIDGMGTPWRSASFHKLWYGDMGDNTLPDQVTAIKQLAKRYSWIDIHRVGIWGHSGGGNATVDAMFTYPDFFKVGWAESGNYDNRNYENDWGEKYQGLLITHKDGSTNYDDQAQQLKAGNLKGHLMLVHGVLDGNVPIGNTYLVVNALIRANKNFDMLILPQAHHDYGDDARYVMRRRWDYFVRYLISATPPPDFRLTPPPLLPTADVLPPSGLRPPSPARGGRDSARAGGSRREKTAHSSLPRVRGRAGVGAKNLLHDGA